MATCYPLLRTIMMTAVDDGLLLNNPVRINGASAERIVERPRITWPDVAALADAERQLYTMTENPRSLICTMMSSPSVKRRTFPTLWRTSTMFAISPSSTTPMMPVFATFF